MDEEAAGLMQSHRVYMVPTLSALATTAACRRGCGIPDSALDKAKAMTKRHQTSFRQAHRQSLLIAMAPTPERPSMRMATTRKSWNGWSPTDEPDGSDPRPRHPLPRD